MESAAADADPVGRAGPPLADEKGTEREARSRLVGASIVVGSAAMAGALVVWRLTGRGGRGA